MDLLRLARGAALTWAVIAGQTAAHAQEQALGFNVLSQRSVGLTAQYWNPILNYVSQKSGVPLELKLTKTPKENDLNAERGDYQFLFTNHFFTPQRDRLGYRVVARPAGPGIRAQIVVPRQSPIQSLHELEGKEVAFATPEAFGGYLVPMDALLKAKINVKPVFAGNQEAAYTQLKIGKVMAAGANSAILQRYSYREGFDYRALWTSDLYNDVCIMANPKVPRQKVDAVQAAFVGMARDPQGRRILEAGADLLKIEGELGFVLADNRDYDTYRAFYKNVRVKDVTKE